VNPDSLVKSLAANLPAIIVALIPALLVAVITAWLTVKLSIKRFHSERWWERKAQAYSDILEQLSIMKHTYDIWIGEEISGLHLAKSYLERVSRLESEAKLKIDQISATGAFYISERSVESLQKVTAALSPFEFNSNVFEILDHNAATISRAINDIRTEAKKDLKVPE
jgi:hypothetical protein